MKTYEDTVTVACVNFEPVVGDKSATLEKIKDFAIKAANQGANIILLPETALTTCSGFPPDEAPAFAETIPGPATYAIEKIAAQYNVYVCFGMIERKGDNLYNAAPVIGPAGVLGVYHKVHPFKPSEPWATPGSEFPLFETPWGLIGVGTCYDNYCFPEVSRVYAVQGARILLHPTAMPAFLDAEDYLDFYRNTLGVRAIDNHMFVASANLCGTWYDYSVKQPLTFFGYSAIFGPKPGQMNYHIYAGPSGMEEEIVMATLDLASLNNLVIGTRYLFKDRLPETYAPIVSAAKPNK